MTSIHPILFSFHHYPAPRNQHTPKLPKLETLRLGKGAFKNPSLHHLPRYFSLIGLGWVLDINKLFKIPQVILMYGQG